MTHHPPRPTAALAEGLRGWWVRAVHGLADLALGERCAGCDQVSGSWCRGCARTAGGVSTIGTVLGLPLVAAGRYDGPLGRAVVAHKERGRLALVRPLGRLLADSVLGLPGPPPVLLVPVPSTAAATRARGQDHAARLAAAAATELRDRGVDVQAQAVLRVVRDVRDQAGLTGAARRANVAGAFAAGRGGPRLRGQGCVVVDDVVTTGASLAAAVTAVTAAGGHVVGCAVVAVAERKARPALAGPDGLG